METLEVLPSSDSADKNHDGSKQPTGDWTFIGDDDVLSQDDFLHFSLSDVTASVDLPMASSVDDSGLEEMLQSGSMLQTKDASCTLAQLLTSASPNAMPLTSVNQAYKMPVIPDSVMIEGEPFNNGVVLPSSGQMVSKHTLSTAGTLVQILQKGSSAATTQSTTSDFSLTFPSTSFTDKSTNNNNNNKSEFSMTSVTRTVNDSDRPDAMAIALAEDNGLFPNLEDNTMPLLNGEDSNISLDNGIEAMDMCSLLEQFEAVENFTSLSDDLLLSAPLDSSSIIKLKEDVDLLGQDQLQLFSPSNCQIIQNEENAETGQTPVMHSQVPAVASDSEVMKLLKAPHITVPRMGRNRAAEQGIPKVAPAPRGDAMQKSKMRTKSRSTILLTDDAIPAMGNKTGSANTNMGKGSTIRKLLRGGVDSSLNSPGASPSRKPVKRLNLSQYRQRTKQQNIGGSEDSNDSCSSSTLEDSHNINIGSNYFDVITDHDYCQNIASCKGTVGDKTKKNVKNESCSPTDDPNCMLKSLLLNKNLSEELKEQAIKDRAVTQRNMRTAGISHEHLEPAPGTETSSLLPSTSSSSSSPSSVSSSSSVVSSVSENSKISTSTSEAKPEKSCTQVSENHRDFGPVISETVEFDQVSQENQKLEQISSEAPKSQEMSPDRQKSREVSPERPPSLHVSPEREKSQEIQPNMRDAPTISPEKLKSRRISPDGHKSRRISPDGHKSRRISPEGQNLRRSSSDRRKPPRFDNKTDIVIDKLPSYCTALALEPIPGMKMKKSISVTNMIDTHIPCCDRDPSPERTGPVFDKVPAYFSCFTNSTKYDKLDPLKIDLDKEAYPWDKIRSDYSSNSSSRRQSPMFTVGDRLSRSSSSSSSLSRSRSPSVGRSWHHSGDRGSLSSPSQSSSSSSPSRSHSRSHSRSRRQRYRSRSRLCRSRSRSHHRSHSRSYRSHSRSHSRHRSRHHSRRRSKYRSRYRSRSRSRSRSRDRYWKKYREEMKVKREREKMQRIEERRIVYIGRIPNDMTKSLLRRTFEQFGDIEEVSVHFREHGDNYGFVTYKYTCDAYAAIERGNMLDGCENYELCFGGRREFCKTAYADLDGDKEDEEEMGSILGRSCKDLDFDTLLKQATKKIKKC